LRRFQALAIGGWAALLAACAGQGALRPNMPASTRTPNPIDLPCMQTSHGCIALNPDVTPANIFQTICVSGYTRTVRPGTGYTNGVKSKLLREAGLGGERMADYELDHIIPLAVGGHPRKRSNLMLQPWTGANGAIVKDALEVQLQHRVCSRQMELAAAQHCIAEDWQACAKALKAAGPVPSGTIVHRYTERAN
jgi:hypothetical protein